MTAQKFRQIALSLPEAMENSHMDHPDFRVGDKIFATLGYPNDKWGMVKLPPEHQKSFSRDYPDAFTPVKGGWGRRGATQVHLESIDESALCRAITAAYHNIAPKHSLRKKPKARRSRS
jgi:predicted DNA-binding protein (MmcQ/YjbR family)